MILRISDTNAARQGERGEKERERERSGREALPSRTSCEFFY